MSQAAWIASLVWIAVATVASVIRGIRAVASGHWPNIKRRLASPTLYLFAGYLLVAAFVTPRSEGESASPMFGLALALPIAYALASFAAAGAGKSRLRSTGLALLYGGAVLALGAVVLSLSSPAFVPPWLR